MCRSSHTMPTLMGDSDQFIFRIMNMIKVNKYTITSIQFNCCRFFLTYIPAIKPNAFLIELLV